MQVSKGSSRTFYKRTVVRTNRFFPWLKKDWWAAAQTKLRKIMEEQKMILSSF